MPPGRPRRWFPFPLHVAAFVVLLGLWTTKLLDPAPVPEDLKEGLAALDLDFLAAKSLHAGGYAFLTVLGALIFPRDRRWRRAVVAFLMPHGAGTEAGQYLMDLGRHGCVRDVLIDWAGIAAGAWVLRRWTGKRES
ncbi:MAG: VanZ family protein [Gemmataceae bacterium]|nr:VanZ family protein [Gemmataceae bacterium]